MTAPSPGGVQRWDLTGRVDLDGPFLCHRLDNASGDWVKYEDHAKEVARLRKALEEIAAMSSPNHVLSAEAVGVIAREALRGAAGEGK